MYLILIYLVKANVNGRNKPDFLRTFLGQGFGVGLEQLRVNLYLGLGLQVPAESLSSMSRGEILQNVREATMHNRLLHGFLIGQQICCLA
jgi:hypothetical protein